MTGGAGFVGHGVVNALMDRGVSVVVLDPGPAHPLWRGGVVHERVGIQDANAVHRLAGEVDIIFHLASVAMAPWGKTEFQQTVNIGGTETLLATGRPVVFTSSSITCGFGTRARPGTEDGPSEDPLHPIVGPGREYRRTKSVAEGLVAEAGGWIVNPDYVLGPGDINGVVTTPLLRAAQLPIIPAPPGGKCFVGVEDVALGHLLAPLRGQPGRRYLLGAENISYAEIFARIAYILGLAPIVLPLPSVLPRLLKRIPGLGDKAGVVEQMTLPRYRSNQRARDELGFCPRPIDDVLRAWLMWLGEEGAL